jgi:hypothetical protein
MQTASTLLPSRSSGIRLTFGTPDGRAWLALYPMQRGSDGIWRTNGCQLRRLGNET